MSLENVEIVRRGYEALNSGAVEGRESGVVVDQSMAHLCTMRVGKLVRHETFWSREAALEAAGQGE